MNTAQPKRIALLLSGGLDSAILLGTLRDQGSWVQPLYVRSHLHWEPAELHALGQFLETFDSSCVGKLVVLNQPVAALYGQHWSVTGREIPDDRTPDESVFLPGRNLLLITQAGLWCQLHGIEQLALAVLGSNPFPDATEEFFASIERCLRLATGEGVEVLRPFAGMEKKEVMHLGRALPLELTFSCINPQGMLHCGACNKCAERKQAFLSAAMTDPTVYANADQQVTERARN